MKRRGFLIAALLAAISPKRMLGTAAKAPPIKVLPITTEEIVAATSTLADLHQELTWQLMEDMQIDFIRGGSTYRLVNYPRAQDALLAQLGLPLPEKQLEIWDGNAKRYGGTS